MSKLRTSDRATRRFLSLTILCLTILGNAGAPAQVYTPGSLDGQNGWSGGGINGTLPFIQPTNEAVTTAAAHSGVQSWRYSDGPTDRGSGTPFSPRLSSAATENAPGAGPNTFVFSLWFKSVGLTDDGSIVTVEPGNPDGDDRSSTTIRFRNDPSSTGLSITMDVATGPSGNPFEFASITLATGLDRATWHQLELTGTFNPGDYNDTWAVSIDNGTPTVQNAWAEWFRDDQSLTYEPTDRLKFRDDNSATTSGATGFYFDDIAYSTFDSADPVGTTQSFSTSFEPIPEPTTVSLIAAAGLILTSSRKRRRC